MRSHGRLGALVAVSAIGLLAGSPLFAQDQGDPARGKDLSNTCLGCHGIPNYKNAFPTYSVPEARGPASRVHRDRPAGLSRRRPLAPHHALPRPPRSRIRTCGISPRISPPSRSRRAAKPVGKAPEAAQVCVACHGPDGVGITAMYPTLAGQHADYLTRALHEYKKGGRKNPIMKTFAEQLNDEQIGQLAQYYSQQLPALKTEERPSTRFGECRVAEPLFFREPSRETAPPSRGRRRGSISS